MAETSDDWIPREAADDDNAVSTNQSLSAQPIVGECTKCKHTQVAPAAEANVHAANNECGADNAKRQHNGTGAGNVSQASVAVVRF